MVVALDDLPPLLWHAELGRSLPDVWTGEHQRGVQLHKLADAVTTWKHRYGQRGWVRQLEGTIEREHEDRLMEVIQRYDGRAFPTTLGLAGQWAKGRVRRRPQQSLEAIYCAELVATTYQCMGLLPSERPPSWYDPGRFWSGDDLELVPPFELGGEIAVSVPDRRSSWRPEPGRRRRRGPCARSASVRARLASLASAVGGLRLRPRTAGCRSAGSAASGGREASCAEGRARGLGRSPTAPSRGVCPPVSRSLVSAQLRRRPSS